MLNQLEILKAKKVLIEALENNYKIQEKYHEAMEYFELKWDANNYSKAFKQYRKEWVEEHIVVIIIIVFAVLCIPLIIGRIKKIKHEIDTADIFKQ